MKYILTRQDTPDRQSMGGKAAALCVLGQQFPIPAWFVIKPEAFFDSLDNSLPVGPALEQLEIGPVIMAEIDAAMQDLEIGESLLAVRSSTAEEDGAEASFAGQFESHLNVGWDQVASKVIEVWRSAFKSSVDAYRQHRDAADSSVAPAVLVQKMVNADVAGVVFGADPVSGDRDTCTAIAINGLADRLVSGEVGGDTYHIHRDGRLISQDTIGDKPYLQQQQLQAVVQLALNSEQVFGEPQDVEWAFENDKLFLLQSRPITTLKSASANGVSRILWDNSNIVESYSGVTTPLTYSFARYVYEAVYIQFCRLMHINNEKIEEHSNAFRNMLGYLNGHIFYNLLNWYRVLSLFPGFSVNRAFMEQMMGVDKALPDDLMQSLAPERKPGLKEKLRDGIDILCTVSGMLLNLLRLPSSIDRFYQRLEVALDLRGQVLEDMPLDRLAAHYRELESRLLSRWDAPLVNDFFCMITFGLSRKLLERYAGDEARGLHNDFMIGQGDIVSAEPARRIKQMAAIVAGDASLQQRLSEADTPTVLRIIEQHAELSPAFTEYMHKFGDRCLQELKLESPTLHDDPTSLIAAIVNLSRHKSSQASELETSDPAGRLKQVLRNRPLRHFLVKTSLNQAKKRIQQRENLRFERTRVFGRVRRIFIEMGKRLQQQQLLQDARDIFYLEVAEILGIVEGSISSCDLSALAESRKACTRSHDQDIVPPSRFITRGAVLPAMLNRLWEADTVLSSTANDHDQSRRSGIGCCPGTVRARIRVITDPRGASLEPGEIMVAQHTDPGWITLFTNASGILVERGSLLSHSAIVAREMGIPAIVSIPGVMSWLQDGDIVEMNGATGVVERIQSGYHE